MLLLGDRLDSKLEIHLSMSVKNVKITDAAFNIPNRVWFVSPISNHVTILLGRVSITLLFVFTAQLCMARNMLRRSKELYQETGHMTH